MAAYVLNPKHPNYRFVRTVTIAGRQPRIVIFKDGAEVELDPKEVRFLAEEIAANWIGLAGVKFPKPEKPIPARLDPSELEDRDPETFEFVRPEDRPRWWQERRAIFRAVNGR